jgi:hypothetical protein
MNNKMNLDVIFNTSVIRDFRITEAEVQLFEMDFDIITKLSLRY